MMMVNINSVMYINSVMMYINSVMIYMNSVMMILMMLILNRVGDGND